MWHCRRPSCLTLRVFLTPGDLCNRTHPKTSRVEGVQGLGELDRSLPDPDVPCHTSRTSVVFCQNSLNRSGDVGTQRFPRTRSALERGGMVRARPTSSVCPDGLVGPQSKTKATRHVDLIRAQLVEVGCGTVAAPFGLALGVPSTRPAPDTTRRQRRRWDRRPIYPRLSPNQAAPLPRRSRSE